MLQGVIGLATFVSGLFVAFSGHPVMSVLLFAVGAGFLNGWRHDVWFSFDWFESETADGSSDDGHGGYGDGGGGDGGGD